VAAEAERPHQKREPTAQRVVLVAEDNEINFELVSAMLERDGFSMRWARDGNEAIAALAADSLDLLILDLHLPRVSGLDVLRHVRSDPASRDLPVLVLTADAMAGTRDAVLAEGASDYMTKPFDLNALRAMVARILP
jgi:CheY-like chemotaxis protein